jgi:menaquinone-dependent protoporphyrinogen oxidase
MADKNKFNRRQFIKLAGGVISGAALACSGLAFVGTRRPKVELPESKCEGDPTTNKVLVTYATRCGSLIGVAEKISEVLCDGGATVEVYPIKEVQDVSAYSAVVIGSAIRMGRWLSEATKFVETHHNTLAGIPTAYFTVCMTLNEDTEANRQKAAAYLDPVRAILEPIDSGLFAGALKPETLSFVEKQIMNAMESPQGDFRNWDAIQSWAERLRPALGVS